MAAHVLVVANVTASSADLIDAIRQRAEKGPIDVTLLMPGQGPGLAGREAVRGRLDEALAAWREAGIEAEGICGDANPMDAVAEDLGPAPPRRGDRLDAAGPELALDRRPTSRRRVARLTGAPVTHVVANDMRPEPHDRPGRRSTRHSPLGPLAVLAWGGSRQVARAGCRTGRPCRSGRTSGQPVVPARPARPRPRGAPASASQLRLVADRQRGVRLRRRRERVGDADVQLLRRRARTRRRRPRAAARASRARRARAARRRTRAPAPRSPAAPRPGRGRAGDHAAEASGEPSSSITRASSWPASQAPTMPRLVELLGGQPAAEAARRRRVAQRRGGARVELLRRRLRRRGPQSTTRPPTIQNASARAGSLGCGASTSREPACAARSAPPSRLQQRLQPLAAALQPRRALVGLLGRRRADLALDVREQRARAVARHEQRAAPRRAARGRGSGPGRRGTATGSGPSARRRTATAAAASRARSGAARTAS